MAQVKPRWDPGATQVGSRWDPGGIQVAQVRSKWKPGDPGGPGETFHWSEIMFGGNADDDGDVESHEK